MRGMIDPSHTRVSTQGPGGDPDPRELSTDAQDRQRRPDPKILLINAYRIFRSRRALIAQGTVTVNDIAAARRCRRSIARRRLQRARERHELFTVRLSDRIHVPEVLLDNRSPSPSLRTACSGEWRFLLIGVILPTSVNQTHNTWTRISDPCHHDWASGADKQAAMPAARVIAPIARAEVLLSALAAASWEDVQNRAQRDRPPAAPLGIQAPDSLLRIRAAEFADEERAAVRSTRRYCRSYEPQDAWPPARPPSGEP